MSWVFEHLQLVIFVGAAIAYWLNQRRKAKEEAEVDQQAQLNPQAAPQVQATVDAEAERVRRIQEEIRRKILERAGGMVPKQQPPPITAARLEKRVEPVTVSVQTRAPEKADAYAQASAEDQTAAFDQAILERQQKLAEQLRELDERRRSVAGNTEVFAEKTTAAMTASGTAVRGDLQADLRTPTAARRAMVMREVLGPPVGLR